MGKVNCSVEISSDCFQRILVWVCGCAHGYAHVGKRKELERLVVV